ncbi:hypothetical protein RU93_GL000599 [Enterococcus aquimarinus]|uniref:Uncharacterized protein n=1 Tax=Enterococcus aquimarinus TaxID=328396 RepID=A0A1L8QQP8_9ENTE|nr:hypothetical protein RU93_GL000599 [Enterococcus aquimarinus]
MANDLTGKRKTTEKTAVGVGTVPNLTSVKFSKMKEKQVE